MTLPILAATLLLSTMQAASPSPSPSPSPLPVPTPVLPRNEALPPSDAQAKAALDSTPRHSEYVNVDFPAGKTKLRTFVVFPERKEKAPVVIVIHEVYGLSDWLRGVADQLAKDGFIAVAPDLISGLGPGGGGTESLPSRDDVVSAIRSLTPADATARLDAVLGWALTLPPPAVARPPSASAGAARAVSPTRPPSPAWTPPSSTTAPPRRRRRSQRSRRQSSASTAATTRA